MDGARVYRAAFLTDIRGAINSNIYLILVGINLLFSIIIAYKTITPSRIYSNIVFQTVTARFFANYLGFFVIFMIAPVLSIAEEIEGGTWDMIRSRIGDSISVVLAKISFQVIFAFVMVAVSMVGLLFVYLISYGHFSSVMTVKHTFTQITYLSYPTGTFKRYSTLTNTHQIHLSFLNTLAVFSMAFLVILPMVLVGIAISRVSRNRISAIIISIGFYLLMSIVTSSITIDSASFSNLLKGVALSLSPDMLYSVIGPMFNLNTMIVVLPKGNYFITLSSPYFNELVYILYILLISSIALMIIMFPRTQEVKNWIRKEKL